MQAAVPYQLAASDVQSQGTGQGASEMIDTRQEHLEWCKARALAYVDRDQLLDACVSMNSDLMKHEETRRHPRIADAPIFELTADNVRRWIEGFE